MRIVMMAVLLVAAGSVHADDLALLRLDASARQAMFAELEATQCTCGCGMTVAECLRDDPTCPVSPGMGRAILAKYVSGGAAPAQQSPVQTRQGHAHAHDSGGGPWHDRLNGRLLVYIQTGMGYRTKECTWLYRDGTFSVNTQGGSVSSLGTSAHGGGGAGRWAVNGDRIRLAYPDGNVANYTLSEEDGLVYLDHYRHFLVDHDDPTCQ